MTQTSIQQDRSNHEAVVNTETAAPAVGETSHNMRLLLLAQLPPPVHGVTMMTRHVHDHVMALNGISLIHEWAGSARQIGDIGRRDAGKLIRFAAMMSKLLLRSATSVRYDLAYTTLAPHGDALLRDALVITAAKKLAPRVLVHLHTQGLDDILAGRNHLHRFVRRALTQTELISVSARTAEFAAQSGRFKAVHHLDNQVADPGPLRHGMTGGQPLRIGYLGNLDERKGVKRFVDVIAALGQAGVDLKAMVAGGPTKNMTIADLRNYARYKGVSDKLKIAGFIEGKTKDDWLRQLDIMIYLSTHDLAPLVLLEAQAHGIVPIAFDTGAIGELLPPAFTGHIITPSMAPEAYLPRILSMCRHYQDDTALLEHDKAIARQHYETRFSPALFRSRLNAILLAQPLQQEGSSKSVTGSLPENQSTKAVA